MCNTITHHDDCVFSSDIFDAMFASKASAGDVIIQQGMSRAH